MVVVTTIGDHSVFMNYDLLSPTCSLGWW